MTESNPEFLEEEKKKDPIERMVNMMERFMSPTIHTATKRPIAIGASSPVYTGPATLELNIRMISNGYLLVVSSPNSYCRSRSSSQEIYVKDRADLVSKVTSETEAFAKAAEEPVPPIHGIDAFSDDIGTAS